MNHKNRTAHGLVRILAVLLAVLMCAGFSAEAGAEALSETAPTVPSETTAETTAETVPEETIAEEVSPSKVSAAELQEAKNDFLALLADEAKERYADLIQTEEWNNAFCREDILAAIDMNIQAIQCGQELASLQNALNQKIQEHGALTEEQRTYYLTALEGMKVELGEYSSAEFFNGLRTLTAESIATVEAADYLSCAEKQTASLQGLSSLLDTMSLWKESNSQIELLSDYLSGTQTSGAAVLAHCRELVQYAARLDEDVNSYFALESEEQQALASKIQAFYGSVNSFYVDTILDSSKDLTALQEEAEQLSRKLVLVYIALGIGVLAVLIGVISAVLVLTKHPEAPALDVSTLATRIEVETLQKQNQSLGTLIELRGKKLDAQSERIASLEAKINSKPNPNPDPKPDPNPDPKPDPNPDPKPDPPKPPASQKVSNLQLIIDVYNPSNSHLEPANKASEYILYDDDSVEYVSPQSASMNTLSGWNLSGVLLLFDPVLNGQAIPSANYPNDPGFYTITTTLRRAKVTALPGGSYSLTQKGAVGIQRISP